LISGTTDDWAQRAGDIYRLKIDDPSNYSFLVYELPENEIAHEVIVDYYSPTGLRPTLAVKNSAGEETKYVEGWDNGYPEITDKGHGLYRCTLKDNLIPEDATQVVIYLDAQSDIELLRNIVYYVMETAIKRRITTKKRTITGFKSYWKKLKAAMTLPSVS